MARNNSVYCRHWRYRKNPAALFTCVEGIGQAMPELLPYQRLDLLDRLDGIVRENRSGTDAA